MKKSEDTKEPRCRCPYCDEEIVLNPLPYCQPCQVELRYCPKCTIVVDKMAKVCHQCGQTLK
jgi:hypothetical protein